MNQAFGLKVLFCFAYTYMWQLYNYYAMFEELVSDDMNVKIFLTMTMWTFNNVWKLVLMLVGPSACKKIAQKIKVRIGFYHSEDTHLHEVKFYVHLYIHT